MRKRLADPVVFFFAAAVLLTALFNKTSDQLTEFKPTVVPPKDMVHFTFGQAFTIADSLWVRVLQAGDFCESPNPKASFNPGLLLEDALKAKLTPSRCHMGWVYRMLDLLTDLNPKFKWAYKMGGVELSIGVDDREGARLIFEKGIKEFPDDWQLLYRAAYHYIFEIQDPRRAEQLLTAVSRHPEAPPVITLLRARLETVTGKGELALGVLREYLKNAKPGTEGYARTKMRIEEIEKQLRTSKSRPEHP
jgi:hypothetical protein